MTTDVKRKHSNSRRYIAHAEAERICQGESDDLHQTFWTMEQAHIYLPDEIRDIAQRKDFDRVHVLGGRIGVGCRKTDSFSMAQEQQKYEFLFPDKKQERVLVLNFANPVHLGGGALSYWRYNAPIALDRKTVIGSFANNGFLMRKLCF